MKQISNDWETETRVYVDDAGLLYRFLMGIGLIVRFLLSVALYLTIVGVLAYGYFSVIDWPPTAGQAKGGALLLMAVAVGTWLGWLWAGPDKE